MAERIESYLGAELREGHTICAWWGRDTILSLRPYDGPYKGMPGWDGCRIAEFARCKTGMTIFAGEQFDVVRACADNSGVYGLV